MPFKSLLIGLLILLIANPIALTHSQDIPVYTYRVIEAYPHDRRAFTQGLAFHKGVLYEGTGLHGHSSLRKVALETGQVIQIHRLSRQFFGEGITLRENKIIQLTWRSRTGFVYDKNNFQLLRTFRYSTEGWGITHNDRYLIMSNGTATLYFLHPDTFEVMNQITVQDNQGPVTHLNELEYVQGEIYANVWKTNRIARIDPATGRVVGWIDLTGLLNPLFATYADVLNGIAFDADNQRLFVTGKHWPRLYEIELTPVK